MKRDMMSLEHAVEKLENIYRINALVSGAPSYEKKYVILRSYVGLGFERFEPVSPEFPESKLDEILGEKVDLFSF